MNSPKKVLMLVHTFPPFGTVGGSIRLIKFLRFMVRGKGRWQPTIITIDPKTDLLCLPQEASFSLDELPDDIRLIRTETGEPTDPQVKPGVFHRIARKIKLALYLPLRKYLLIPDDKVLWTSTLEAAALEELDANDYSLIYATAPPFSVLLAAEKIKRQSNLPLVIDIKDDWIVEPRFRGLKRFRKGIESSMERRCIDAADKIILVTQRSHDEYYSRYPEHRDKFELIHNGCDVEEYKNYWSQRPASFDKFTLIHTGVFSARRDMSALFHALKRMVTERPEAEQELRFMIVGVIPTDQRKIIAKLQLTNIVQATGYMDRDAYVETLVRAHLPVVINYSVPSLIPGKLYEYWGSRNRMLLLDSKESAAADIVNRYELGAVIEPDDQKAIHAFLCEAYDAWLRGEAPLCDVSQIHLFDRRVLTRKLEVIFSDLVSDTCGN